jgi:hypothetical protein
LKTAHPELAAAIDMQLDLLEAQRRVQSRVPLPSARPDPDWLLTQQAAGGAAVRFADIPLEWSDFRFSMRQTADILYRHGILEREEHDETLSLARDSALPDLVRTWYDASSQRRVDQSVDNKATPNLSQVLALAIRPFLVRSANALEGLDFSAWHFGHCPYCGWEPEFAAIAPSGERRLICGRCTAHWTFGAFTCPFCANDDSNRVTSFETPDRQYRVYACDACRRYLKAHDGRYAARPALPAVDTIATLLLDALAVQRGYVS